MTTVLFEVLTYDESTDLFTIHVPCPDLGRDTPENDIDVDDFTVPGALLPLLTGEYGEPDEFIGRTFSRPLP